MMHSGQLNIYSYRNAHTNEIQNVRLFECEELRAYLVVMPPGDQIAPHVHDNSHEIFDVIDGRGIFEVSGRIVSGDPGRCVFVPAGVSHSLRNESDQAWTLRVTYQDRVYPRHIGKLIRRSIQQRLE